MHQLLRRVEREYVVTVYTNKFEDDLASISTGKTEQIPFFKPINKATMNKGKLESGADVREN